jgi:hypothetical protein
VAKQPQHTTNREVGNSLSNLVLAINSTKLMREAIDESADKHEKRQRKLRNITLALMRPVLQLIDEGVMNPEEGRQVFVSGALAVHSLRVNGVQGIKLPAFQDFGKRILVDAGEADEQV